jgi:staphylococcal nuclease domain-containing protein 1
LGQLFFNNQDFGLSLIQQGLAKLHYTSLKKAPFFNTYKAAEDAAKKAKLGVWEDYNFEEEETKRNEQFAIRAATQTARASYPISVTDIRSGSNFSFQILDDETALLNELAASLHNEKFSSHPRISPKKGEIVAAQFTVDDVWYRAQILSDPAKNSENYEVRYIDYGNREVISPTRIRELPHEYVELIPPQARDGKLLFVKAPDVEKSEFGRDSTAALHDLLFDKTLFAEQVYTDKIAGFKDAKEAQYLYHLIITEDKVDLNKAMISHGQAKVEKVFDPIDAPYYQALLELQKNARDERLGIWQYGDYPDSEDEETQI